MPSPQPYAIFRHIRKLAAAQAPNPRSDMQLLQQFIADCDEDAFAALVRRHGAMVLGVSRSVLQHQQDAEDVLQATFLVLARKANSIRKHDSLGSWLHGVAFRLATKVKLQSRRQRSREEKRGEPASASSIDDLSLRELRAILHEEMSELTECYRSALLLCYWEGKTRDEAAGQVGMSPGEFKKCLERARKLLGSRLVRRGLVPSAAFFAMLFSESGLQAALSGSLIKTTSQAALAFAVGHRAGVSATVAVLAEGVIHTMNVTKWATAILAILITLGLGAGATLGGYFLLQGSPGEQVVLQPAVDGAQVGKAKAGDASDKDRIVGIWRIDKATENGRTVPDEIKAMLRFHFAKDGAFSLAIPEELEKGATKKGTYQLVGPGKIDLKFENKKNAEGIFKLEGKDRLTICMPREDGKRPAEFSADKDTFQVLFTLVRAKPGEEKPSAKEIAALKKNAPRDGPARQISVNNFKQIALAMHNYHDAVGNLPAHAIYSKDGKTALLSWRVAILPYIEQQDLYNQFKLDEPWDSKHNIKLVAKMPKIYQMPPPTKAKEGETYYQVFTGEGAVFNGSKKMKFTDIKDGTSNTIMIVEAKDPVVWTKPADLSLPKQADEKLPVGGRFKDGFNAAFCDGSVRFLPDTIEAAKLRAYITAAGGD
ncbi:MAG TPA: sigma-70 family RNA polymerase sigma factor [Gemmataceae bacterium]|nr:sigma-70 family RNA polymerase sigma factor [Gemmataceae bacterium]